MTHKMKMASALRAELVRLCDASRMLVHDLKSPLAVIVANAAFLRDEPQELERAEALRDIEAAAKQAVRIVENVLQLLHLELEPSDLKPVPTLVGPLVEEVVSRRRREAQRGRLALSAASTSRLVAKLDHDVFARILDNLIDNAFRYTPTGGRIEVAVAPVRARVQVSVGNTGPAIPPELRERVFEKHAQLDAANSGSLGLGLYFCRAAVEAHRGTIRVEESPRLPALFIIELPAMAHARASGVPLSRRARATRKKH